MKVLALIAVLALTAAACSSGAGEDRTLTGQWDVAAMADDTGTLNPPVEGSLLTATITEAEIYGSSGCNSYMGAAAIDGSSVSFGPLAATLKACPEAEVMQQESELLTLLQTVDTWESTSDGIDLKVEGETVVQLTPTDTSLQGTSWNVIAINNQNGGVESVVIDSDPTLVFDEESGVSGSTGCNNYFGSFTTDGDTIEFSDIGSTEMFCEDTADQETSMFAALAGAATYTVDAQMLELFDESGSRLLTATR